MNKEHKGNIAFCCPALQLIFTRLYVYTTTGTHAYSLIPHSLISHFCRLSSSLTSSGPSQSRTSYSKFVPQSFVFREARTWRLVPHFCRLTARASLLKLHRLVLEARTSKLCEPWSFVNLEARTSKLCVSQSSYLTARISQSHTSRLPPYSSRLTFGTSQSRTSYSKLIP